MAVLPSYSTQVSNIPTLNFAKNAKFRMGHPSAFSTGGPVRILHQGPDTFSQTVSCPTQSFSCSSAADHTFRQRLSLDTPNSLIDLPGAPNLGFGSAIGRNPAKSGAAWVWSRKRAWSHPKKQLCMWNLSHCAPADHIRSRRSGTSACLRRWRWRAGN